MDPLDVDHLTRKKSKRSGSPQGALPPMSMHERRLSGGVIELKEEFARFREDVNVHLHMLSVEIDRIKSGAMYDIDGKLSTIHVAVETLKAHPKLASQEDGLQQEATAGNGEVLPPSDPAAGMYEEERMAKLEARVERLSGEVSELKSDSNQEKAEEAPVPPGSTDQPEVVMSNNEQIDSDYTLQEKTWDLVILIGVQGVGEMASVFGTIVLILNALMQLMLCFIINDVFTSPDISEDDVNNMKFWRVAFGHSINLMNPYTFEPYARGVCRHVGGIQMNTVAVDLLDTIENYMPPKGSYEQQAPPVGPILPHIQDIGVFMSTIAVMIWILEITTAILSVRSKMLAFWYAARGERTVIVDLPDSREIKHVSFSRKLVCLSVGMIEMSILLLLGWSGTLFIVHTLHLQDLLLNCSALVIVLEVSRLVFGALVPQRTKSLLASLEPLPRPTPATIGGLSPSSYISMVVIMITTSVAFWALKLQESTLKDVREEICGGNQDFIAKPDASGIITAGFDEQVNGFEHMEKTYSFLAIRQLVLNEAGNVVEHRLTQEDMSGGSSGMDGGPWSLLEWTNLGVSGAMEYWNDKCADMLPISNGVYPYANHFLHILRDTADNYDILDCTQVKKWCNDDSEKGIRTRQACPATCGCNDPGSRLVLLGDNACSPTCSSTPVYNKSSWSRDCSDLKVGDAYWSQYAEGLVQYLSTYSGAGGSTMAAEAAAITANGCDIVSKPVEITVLGIVWTDPCRITAQRLKPFTHACPVSCKCRSDNPPPFCPASCR